MWAYYFLRRDFKKTAKRLGVKWLNTILLQSWFLLIFLHTCEWVLLIEEKHEQAFTLKKGGLWTIIAWTILKAKGII
jgi:hypothetical protein